MNNLIFWNGEAENRYDEQLGLVTYLCNRSLNHRDLPLKYIDLWIAPAVRHRQIMFVFDKNHRRVAYFTWARLTQEVRNELLTGALLHESEWNEGDILCFLDFVAPFGHAKLIISHIRTTLFLDADRACSIGSAKRTANSRFRNWRR